MLGILIAIPIKKGEHRILTQEDKRYLEKMMDGKLSQLKSELGDRISKVDSDLRRQLKLYQEANINHHVQTREMLADLRQENAQFKERLHAATAP